MKARDNPYNPGAGTPPPELAGRDDILQRAEDTIARTKTAKAVKSLMLLGLRGVGKTVLLNRIERIAEDAGCETAMFEASAGKSLAEQITPQLHRLLLKLDRGKNLGEQARRAFSALRDFASAFKVKYGDLEVGLSGSATGDLAIDLTDLLVSIGEASQARKTVAVLLVDEVQFVSKEDLEALIMALHKISQRQLPLLMFGAGLPQLAGIAGDAKSYAERLFDYPDIGKLDRDSAIQALVEPAERQDVHYDTKALNVIIDATEGYPFFLQVWGSHAWEVAAESPITADDAKEASKRAIAALDKGFFQVRLDRLTDRQLDYARAMAELGPGPSTSTAVAKVLGISVSDAAPIRNEVIKKGMAYSPKRGRIAFTVPKFDEFMRRAMELKAPKRQAQTKSKRRSKPKTA